MSQFTSVNLKNIRIIVNKGIHYRQFHSETPLKATVAIQTKEAPQTAEFIDPEWETAKPFEQIPGPSVMGVIRRSMPGGAWHKKDLGEQSKLASQEYGGILKMPELFGRPPLIMTQNEKDFEKIYRTEGVWPVRPHFYVIDYYRQVVRKDKYKQNAGLISEDGERWHELRSKVNPIMLKPNIVKRYIPSIDIVTTDFIQRIKEIRNPNNEMPENFFEELNKWGLESIGTIALESRIGCFDRIKNARVEKTIEAVRNVFRLIHELEFEPSLWQYIATPGYKKMIRELDYIDSFISQYIDKGVAKYSNSSKSVSSDEDGSVLEKLLKIDKHIAVLMSSDMILAGIDTTSTHAAGVLLELAKNPEKQAKLYEEVCKILPNKDSPLTIESMVNAPYLRACLKEAIRLHAVIPVNGRLAGQDIVLSGYRIPKGTFLFLAQYTLEHDDNYYEKSKEFIPERWLKEKDPQCPIRSAKDVNPFIHLPFGHGPRSCVGRRFAELEVEILITRLIREFKIEWNHGPVDYNISFVLAPASPLKFKLTERRN